MAMRATPVARSQRGDQHVTPSGQNAHSRFITVPSIAELGTCYLSPAYDDMVQALSEFTAGNARVAVAHGPERGIVVGTPPNKIPSSYKFPGGL